MDLSEHYGVRFRQSFASDERWYWLNRYRVKQRVRAAAVLIVLVTFVLPFEVSGAGVVGLLLVIPIMALIAAYVTYRHARHLEETA